MAESIDRLIKMMNDARKISWMGEFTTEEEFVVSLCERILLPLFGEVTLEKRYQKKVCNLSGARAEHIGMGAKNTWHGTPDLRVKGCDLLMTADPLVAEDEAEESDEESQHSPAIASPLDSASPTSVVNFEGKINMKKCHLDQLIATGVVSAFTEHKLNPKLNPLVPTILINKTGFRICLYDSINDVLLISKVKNLIKDWRLSRSGLLLLWIVVHHR